jgi:hypothetical protein
MKNFRCADCGHEFNKPLHIHEREVIDYGIGRSWVTLWEGDVCPECEGINWDDMPEPEPEDETI